MTFSKKSWNKLKTTNINLQDVFLASIKFSPIDFGISQGLRTEAEQFELYKKGRGWDGGRWVVDDASKIVTYRDGKIRKSNHQSGNAVDVFAWADGKVSWKFEHYHMIAGVVLWVANSMEVKIQWGGHWKSFKDYPHFELIQ